MDPYKVLGVKRTATDEEIKAAYHELVKKYHPDKYVDNPLADLAEEKLREVNEAYDLLMKPSTTANTSSGGAYSSTYGSTGGTSYQGSYTYGNYNTGNYNNGNYGGYDHGQGTGSYGQYSGAEYSNHYDVRAALDRNQLVQAEQYLNASANRDAEWYFLAGVLSYKKGYYDDALSKMSYAISMDPSNVEYRNVYQQIRGTGALYKTDSTRRGYNNSSLCSDLIMCYCCSSLISPCW